MCGAPTRGFCLAPRSLVVCVGESGRRGLFYRGGSSSCLGCYCGAGLRASVWRPRRRTSKSCRRLRNVIGRKKTRTRFRYAPLVPSHLRRQRDGEVLASDRRNSTAQHQVQCRRGLSPSFVLASYSAVASKYCEGQVGQNNLNFEA